MCVGENMKECKSEREDQSVHLGDRERENVCIFAMGKRNKRLLRRSRERESKKEYVCVCERAF